VFPSLVPARNPLLTSHPSPQLIGTGTAVAAAASGLIFGQLDDDQPPSALPRPNPNKRKQRPEDLDLSAASPWTAAAVVAGEAAGAPELVSPLSLTNHQTTAEPPRLPQSSLLTPLISPRFQNLRHSWARQFDLGASPIAEDTRDSVSSNGSWIRRLSLRPLSQHESVKSSSAPDSQSMFSHGSAAPILSPTVVKAPQLPPNKLVKRSTKDGVDLGPPAKRSSRSQIPILRRPATSHQRSATLHRLSVEAVPPISDLPIRESSIVRTLRPRAQTVAAAPNSSPITESPPSDTSRWKSFFHARIVRVAIKVSSRKSDSNAQPSAKRICTQQDTRHQPYLIKPKAMMAGPDASEVYPALEPAQTSTAPDATPQTSDKTDPISDEPSAKIPRRSISMQFSSKANWLSKTSSIRRRKRGASGMAAGTTKRSASDPATYKVQLGQEQTADMVGTAATQTRAGGPSRVESELAAIFKPPSRSSSSPLPPLSRISSFHFDLNRLSSAGSQDKSDEPASAVYSTSALRVNSSASQARTLDRASTVGSSEYHRGFMSGDDDDTDTKTDTPFDSIRTAGSERRKTLDSPLEFMFDDSPPSTSSNSKQPKRLSIQEILGPAFDGGNKIMEEDEGLPTPIRGTYDDAEAHFQLANFEDERDFNNYSSVSSGLNLASRDFGRLSIDDDDDLDWTRDDEEEIYNHLSPPSSMNSRRESPNQRTALTTISGNGGRDSHRDSADDRPRSNIFDWADPAPHDKPEVEGCSTRPRTVHGKREMDIRGGRSVHRRGPIAAHIRSQSVPVVHDPTDSSKTTPKFGTWGLGSKNVSEDWDDDFEFEEEAEEADVSLNEGKKSENRLSMVVPASIQATQPTVMAHSGQIRELSLLVNDLKRLCRLGREMDMIDGPFARLWRDAEGIIALASPDDDELDDGIPSPVAEEFDVNLIDQRFVDAGFDGGALDHANPTAMVHEQLKTPVIKERTQARRRSVFSPEDDIFGNWPHFDDDDTTHEQPRTPESKRPSSYNPSSVARSLMESMHLHRVQPDDATDHEEEEEEEEEEPTGRLDFDTNSLKELVKRASDLRDSLSDLVRRADHISHSPVCTPRKQRSSKNEDGSPAFTRVFDDPASTPTQQLPHSRSNNSMLSSSSVAASPNGLSQRLQLMTVS
jgi:hypothetical protein